MKYIGAHVSIAGGVSNAPHNATEIGAKAFAMFTKNQRQWVAPKYTQDEIDRFKAELKKSGIAPQHVLPHAGYLINLGHPDPGLRKQSLDAFIDEINRCSQLGLVQINFHPGHHKNLISETECISLIANSLNQSLAQTAGVTLAIENTAGQGSAVGYKLEHLAELIAQVNDKTRIGVCIDTCHFFVSGYDFRDKTTYQKTWDQFEAIVGFKYLRGMHLNDSMSVLGSKIDRHESLGAGNLGLNAFKLIMQDARMDNIPLILETIDPALWPTEIRMLYQFFSSP